MHRPLLPGYGLVTVLACLALTLSATAASAATSAARPMKSAKPTKLWLVKDNDLAAIGNTYGHDFRWVACGIGTAPPFASNNGPCAAGQARIYGDYWKFRKAVLDGQQAPGTTVVFDQEHWRWTPLLQQEHPWLYEKLAGLLARKHHIFIIMTTSEQSAAAEIADAAAAAPYASAVAVQSQYLDGRPRYFRAYVIEAVSKIRKASKTVPILAGLAPDAGGVPITAFDMTVEYRAVYAMVSGFWVNADQWQRGVGCATTGCGQIVDQFLANIGVIR